jgi:hypothetical protein
MNRTHIRAFSVAEFSAVNKALREIRTQQAGTNKLTSEQESALLSQRIQEILDSSDHLHPCNQ